MKERTGVKSRMRTRERGQDLVEFALILPLLLLLLLGIMEFAVVIFNYNTLANAAREGARAGVVPGANEGAVVAAALQLTTGLSGVDVDVDMDANTVSVTVIHDSQLITGSLLVPNGVIPLQATSTMRRE